MTVSTHRVVPEADASGTAPYAETPSTASTPFARLLPTPPRVLLSVLASSADPARQALARAARDDFPDWLDHVKGAAECSRPIRLSGNVMSVEGGTGRLLSTWDTASLPDGVIYKRCGNRRSGVCPSCSKLYQRDAYQVIRAGIVGGKGVPDTVAAHPCIFATFTAPSFGAVHHRVVKRHTCENRARCDCRAEPCHPLRNNPMCEHGRPQACYARHEGGDRRIGVPVCADCYDYDSHVVWNLYSGELWRRTTIALNRELKKLCKDKAIPPVVVWTGSSFVKKPAAHASCGKAAEFQARAAVHFHALVRLDGVDPMDPTAIAPPPAGLTVHDVAQAIKTAAAQVSFTTPPHPDHPLGWNITWGDPDKGIDTRPVTVSGHGEITDTMVAGYLAKYATKSTEVTGHTSARITEANISRYADASGNHVQRLVAACWRLGRPIAAELFERQQSQLLQALAGIVARLGQNPSIAAHLTLAQRHDSITAALTELQTKAPQPLGKRASFLPPTPGAAQAWICPTCGTRCTTVHCQVCPHQRNDRAYRQQQMLFLLLLAQAIQPPDDDTNPYTGLRRWAHMLGYGGHFLTKSRRYSIAFRILREARITFRRNETTPPTAEGADADRDSEQTTVIINSLSLAGVGWHTSADAMLAQTSSALAQEHQQLARQLIDAIEI
jgi:Replication initiator protein, pSAM2